MIIRVIFMSCALKFIFLLSLYRPRYFYILLYFMVLLCVGLCCFPCLPQSGCYHIYFYLFVQGFVFGNSFCQLDKQGLIVAEPFA